MTSTEDSYATQVSALAEYFSFCCAAAALFYWDDNHNQGLRVEATSIMREFVDGVPFGRDPEGILFYNALSDLGSRAGTVYYSVYYHSGDSNARAIRIDFHTKKDDSKASFASFLTKDANKVETNLLKNGSGTWGEQQMGTCSANIYKVTSETKVTLSLKPIEKKATFTIVDNDVTIKDESGNTVKANKLPIDIDGVFHFKLIDDLESDSTSVANYNRDRLLFYPSGKADQLVGVFFPNKSLPIDDSHVRSTSSTATWE